MTKSSHASLSLIREIYGGDEAFAERKLNRLSAQCDLFEQYYGCGAVKALRAPVAILDEGTPMGALLRAAELLSGPWRDTLNAATILGQSKSAQQLSAPARRVRVLPGFPDIRGHTAS